MTTFKIGAARDRDSQSEDQGSTKNQRIYSDSNNSNVQGSELDQESNFIPYMGGRQSIGSPSPKKFKSKDDSYCGSTDNLEDNFKRNSQNGSHSYIHHIKSDPLQMNPDEYPQNMDDVAEDLTVAPDNTAET